MKLKGNEIITIDDYDVLFSYIDCWKCTPERHNAVFQGIVEADGQTENAIKHRINAGDKASNASDEMVAAIFNNKFCIPLDFEILKSSLPSQIRTEYMKSSILYDRILRSRIIPLNNSSISFSLDINSPSKSLKGVLLIFTKERIATKFNRDTEEFKTPR